MRRHNFPSYQYYHKTKQSADTHWHYISMWHSDTWQLLWRWHCNVVKSQWWVNDAVTASLSQWLCDSDTVTVSVSHCHCQLQYTTFNHKINSYCDSVMVTLWQCDGDTVIVTLWWHHCDIYCDCKWVCLNVRACAPWERVVTWWESTTSHELLALLLRLWLLSVADAWRLIRPCCSKAPRPVEPLQGAGRPAVTTLEPDSLTGPTLKQ